MRIKLTSIVWDAPKRIDLPKEMIVEIEADEYDDTDELAIDKATDRTGWCIKSADTETLPEIELELPAILDGV